MSTSDLFLYPPSESASVTDLPFFAPPPQPADAPSPETFDNEVGDIDLDWSFEQFEDFFSTFRDTVPASTASAWTLSTDSAYDLDSTQYSYGITQSASEYSTPSDLETCGSVDDGLHVTQDSPSFPPLNPVKAQSDYGVTDLYPNFVGISRDDISGVVPVREMFDSKVQTVPVRVTKPFKCPHCPFASARKHNLKTHVGTHNKEESNRFECGTCRRRFSRKHDLRRHRSTIHGDQVPSSVSKSRFDPGHDLPQYHYPINGDPGVTSPGCSNASSYLHPAHGAPEDIMAWYKEFEACLQEV